MSWYYDGDLENGCSVSEQELKTKNPKPDFMPPISMFGWGSIVFLYVCLYICQFLCSPWVPMQYSHPVTSTLEFGLLFEYFNLANNFLTVNAGALIFQMSINYTRTSPWVPTILICDHHLVVWTTFLRKKLTLLSLLNGECFI